MTIRKDPQEDPPREKKVLDHIKLSTSGAQDKGLFGRE